MKEAKFFYYEQNGCRAFYKKWNSYQHVYCVLFWTWVAFELKVPEMRQTMLNV